MSGPSESRDEIRKGALTAFLDEKVGEGFGIETRTDTHAIIVPAHRGWSFLDRLRNVKPLGRQVISVDERGEVTMAPAEPLRS